MIKICQGNLNKQVGKVSYYDHWQSKFQTNFSIKRHRRPLNINKGTIHTEYLIMLDTHAQNI